MFNHKQLVFKLWLIVLSLLMSSFSYAETPQQLSGQNVLVLYKNNDSHSKQIADYYSEKRNIPEHQVVSVAIKGSPSNLNQKQFEKVIEQLKPNLTSNIKVILLTWHAPYRVECMSITSAFALGFDKKYCSRPTKEIKGCHPTAISPYYNAASSTLWDNKTPFRLSMMLSGKTVSEAKKLIDRGIAADNSQPEADAYLVRTHDRSRSSRWPIFERFAELWGKRKGLTVNFVDDRPYKGKTRIKNKDKIMFYHTGLTTVPSIETNTYLPGAIAEHLTSGAGVGIDTNGQMKAFRWLEAGVTGSYGAVTEPCNYPEKFPNPQVLIPSYLDGKTLIEAYWKSVQQPGEGLFVGEPLARPWAKSN